MTYCLTILLLKTIKVSFRSLIGVLTNGFAGEKGDDIDTRHLITADPRAEACFDQIRSWLVDCMNHESCKSPLIAPLPRCIIEVPRSADASPKLTLSNGRFGRYLILSHCNGGFEISQLGDSKYGELDLSVLPKTFQDAIEITRRLGFEYLWIAALCGGQNDPKIRAEEIAKFPSTYGQCVMMLSASAGTDVHAGILNDRLVLQSPALGKSKDRYLRQNFLRWPSQLEDSPLAHRGWALQERILTPRVLHFTSRQMIYECAEDLKFEASGILDKNYGSMQIRKQYHKSRVQPFVEAHVRGLSKNPYPGIKLMPELLDYQKRLEAWHQCVDEFSKRTLGDPSHKLPAMACLAKVLDNDELGDYMAGIWSKNIGIGLAWSRVYGVLSQSPTYRAPSFSWASVDGEVSSFLLNWPETMLSDQAVDLSWINRHGPKLLSTNMFLADPSKPYEGVKEGSSITISGACLGLSSLLSSIKPKTVGETPLFCGTLALDQSWVLDCPCCGPKHPSDEEFSSEYKKFQDGMEHHICVILQGDGWKSGDSDVVLLVLRREGSGNGGGNERYVRVGMMRLILYHQYKPVWENEDRSFNSAPVHKEFDALGWDRRSLQLF
jgi:hypothetical protein